MKYSAFTPQLFAIIQPSCPSGMFPVLFHIVINNPQGYLNIVLHAHLPYVRCPKHDFFLEENWFYEALTETYIPLLGMFEQLLNNRVDFRITVSLSPTLLSMMTDDLLKKRYSRHLDRLIDLAGEEIKRTGKTVFHPLASMYRQRFREIKHRYEQVYHRDLASAFRSVAESGCVELITTAATHAYLPPLISEPASIRAQLTTGRKCFAGALGTEAKGIWLPECGFAPEMDNLIAESGAGYFFLESHSLIASTPQAAKSIYAPVATPSGAIAFARDVDSAHQVWSSLSGYPGDPDYRDFYRDIGFDLDIDTIQAYLPGGVRSFTGLKYYSITGKTDIKAPYDIKKAEAKALLHASDFLEKKKEQSGRIRQHLNITPVITAAFDAELFGHWWFEGIDWLAAFLTKAAADNEVRLITPSDYLSENKIHEICMPSMSSWGKKGYGRTWVDDSNNWAYRHIMHASRMMADLADRNPHAEGLLKRALNQSSRELLLAQSSDWLFMIRTGNAAQYATNRLADHINSFLKLHKEILSGEIKDSELKKIESTNTIFPGIDYRAFKKSSSQPSSLLNG